MSQSDIKLKRPIFYATRSRNGIIWTIRDRTKCSYSKISTRILMWELNVCGLVSIQFSILDSAEKEQMLRIHHSHMMIRRTMRQRDTAWKCVLWFSPSKRTKIETCHPEGHTVVAIALRYFYVSFYANRTDTTKDRVYMHLSENVKTRHQRHRRPAPFASLSIGFV